MKKMIECSYMSNGRFERNPLLASRCGGNCCCCCCCSYCGGSSANFRVSTNPSLLYGLRQSSLIQWSLSRKLALCGRDRYHSWVPDYDIDSYGYEVSCFVRERNGGGRFEKKGKRRFDRVNSRGRIDYVNAVISLLSEELSGECSDDGGGKWDFSKKEETKSVVKRERYAGRLCRGRRGNVRLDELESGFKGKLESEKLKKEKCSCKEERDKGEDMKQYKERQEREEMGEEKAVLRGENSMARKASSSFSSYYSLSSSGEFGSDKEADDEQVDFLEEPSTEYRAEAKSGTDKYNGRVDKEIKNHRGSIQSDKKDFEQRENVTRTCAEWDLRKKTEKKLTEIEEIHLKKDHMESRSRISRAGNSNFRETSRSHKQINAKDEISSSAIDLDKRTRNVFSETATGVLEQATYKRNQQVTSAQEAHGSNTEDTARVGKMFSEKQLLDEELIWERRNGRSKLDGESIGKDSLIVKGQGSMDSLEIGNVNARDSGQRRLSGSTLKIQEEAEGGKKGWDTNRLHYERSDQLSGQIDSRRSKNFSTLISGHDSQRAKTSILHSGTSAKHEKGIVSVPSGSGTSSSSTDTKSCQPDRDQINLQMVQLNQESQDVTNISLNVTNLSVVHPEKAKDSQGPAERWSDLNRISTAGVEHVQENTEDFSIDGSLSKLRSRNKPRKFNDRLGLHEEILQGTLDTESSSGVVSIEEAYETEGTSKNYRNPSVLLSPKNALSSAQRSDETSLQFLGEFVEKARHELSTSKIIAEENPSDRNWSSESESHRQEPLDKSSIGSGVKGPSDEIWDLRDPHIQKPQEMVETEEGAGSDNIVRRTGKSLWSTIANAFRLRWNSHTEISTSAKRLGVKSSSNESVSSETWFSGNEPDENIHENVKSESSRPHEATSSDKLKRWRSSPRGQGGISDSRRQQKSDSSLPLVSTSSGSTPVVHPSPFDEETLAHGQEIDAIESVMEIGSTSHNYLPAVSMSGRRIVEENVITGEIDVSGRVLVSETEHPLISKPTDEPQASEGDEGKLKLRKFQRSKQVLGDRFDAWEEAYVIESERRKMDELFMKEALIEAKKAGDTWEVPVGAVLVQHGIIIARGHNLVEELRDSTAHAEMICIREASNQLRSWRLVDTTLYVTLEPCPMCAGAILQARVNTLVWGAPNKLVGADGSWIRLFNGGNESESSDKPAAPLHPFHPNMTIRRGILGSECADVMQQFFQLRRRKREEKVKKDEEKSPQPSSLPIPHHHSKILTKMHGIFHGMLCM